MQKTKSSSSTTTTYRGQRDLQSRFQKRNSTHRRQGDLLEIHPCILQDIPGIPATPVAPEAFRTFQSFMTFQPFQAILQILQCSSISRESTPFQHSPIKMHILHILQILQFDWFPQKLHRVPFEQLQTFYKHYILQRKGDVAISVKQDTILQNRIISPLRLVIKSY